MTKPIERAEHIYSATLFQYLNPDERTDFVKQDIVDHIEYEITQALKDHKKASRNPRYKHLYYARYVALHKYFVFIGCRRLGVNLFQALIHDWSKLLPVEWIPYTNHFYGSKPIQRDETGYYDASKQDDAFVFAWLHHQHLNPHHWQHYVLKRDDGDVRVLPMKEKHIREMVADWFGAGLTQSIIEGWDHKPNPKVWYEANKGHILLHPDSVKILLPLLDIAASWPECV